MNLIKQQKMYKFVAPALNLENFKLLGNMKLRLIKNGSLYCNSKKVSYSEKQDIAANLVDGMYTGLYNRSQKHNPDLQSVLKRSWEVGIQKIIITGTSLEDSEKAVEISKTDERLYATVGCHPTCCNDIATAPSQDAYLTSLVSLCANNKDKVVAFGEFGLDYDRLHFCPKEVQLKYFEEQLMQLSEVRLPLFLHCRNASEDFISLLKKHRDKWNNGVVHSFDGSEEDLKEYLDLGLYIGINGCSLKTEDNLLVAKTIPSDRLLLETDCPWCEVKPSHAGFQYIKTKFSSVKKEKWDNEKMVKGRNEPAGIIHILEIIAGIREEEAEILSQQIFNNSNKLFF